MYVLGKVSLRSLLVLTFVAPVSVETCGGVRCTAVSACVCECVAGGKEIKSASCGMHIISMYRGASGKA